PTPRLHLYVLLDRSGSMESIRDDVLGGFNELLGEQKAAAGRTDAGPAPRVTLVQFDSQDPQEVVLDAARLSAARPLDQATFVPRGGTPLLDATAALIGRAAARVDKRRILGKRPESIVFVSITDGQENSSTRHTLKDVLALVDAKRAEGWTFAFLNSTVDAYDDATKLGYDHRSVQAFAPDGAGARAAFRSTSAAVMNRRVKLAKNEAFDAGDLFEGDKPAEVDRNSRT
ncbi:MAG: VWA domain-containing protein, partial [Acidimicrobiia bacterium]|nr:VWA domain-containing protein [Acidimicrobiia bacterium]